MTSPYDITLRQRLMLAFVASMMGLGLHAAPRTDPGAPRLVVGIMVEDLQPEYLNLLRQYFSQGGFNRFINDGVVLSDVDYGTWLDPAAATAVIYTGAAPSLNGIPSASVFDRATLHSKPVFTDPGILGNYTDQTFSPKALSTSTIADELRIASDGASYAYAVAAEPEQALVMGGHGGNCAVWLNPANDRWATTTYYKAPPSVLDARNRYVPLSSRIDTMVWRPMYAPDRYTAIPAKTAAIPFKYTFNHRGPQRMQTFKASPLLNDEVTGFAIQHINDLALGTHTGTDMLSLAYTLQPYPYANADDNRYELIDAYYRLDRDLQLLLEAIERKVGLRNAVVFIASTPPSNRSRRDDKKWQIPYGEFSSRRAVSLLNLYFVSIYGQGDWVQGYHDGHFYLNHKLIKDSGKSIETLRAQAAAFLEQMEGVGAAYSLDDIILNRAGLHAAPLKRNTHIKTAGDVRIKVLPGWQLLDDYNSHTTHSDLVSREAVTTAPVLILAPDLTPQTIGETIDARAIAPTICRILRIRSPNGASLAPVRLK